MKITIHDPWHARFGGALEIDIEFSKKEQKACDKQFKSLNNLAHPIDMFSDQYGGLCDIFPDEKGGQNSYKVDGNKMSLIYFNSSNDVVALSEIAFHLKKLKILDEPEYQVIAEADKEYYSQVLRECRHNRSVLITDPEDPFRYDRYGTFVLTMTDDRVHCEFTVQRCYDDPKKNTSFQTKYEKEYGPRAKAKESASSIKPDEHEAKDNSAPKPTVHAP